MTLEINIVGGGTVGRALAARLTRRDDTVRIIEQDESKHDAVEATGARFIAGDGTDVGTLDRADSESVDVFVAATGDDDTNLLASQLALTWFDAERIIARVNRRENVEPFDDLGIRPVAVSEATAREIDNYIERPSFTGFIEELSHSGDAQEVELRNPAHDGATVGELDDALPEQCLIVTMTHDEVTQFPDANFAITLGDRLTVVGERAAVARAREQLASKHPEPSAAE